MEGNPPALPNLLGLPVDPDSFTVALDETAEPTARWKMMARVSTGKPALLCTSKVRVGTEFGRGLSGLGWCSVSVQRSAM